MASEQENSSDRIVEEEATTPLREAGCYDFAFAYRNACFSDRVLDLESLDKSNEASEVSTEQVPANSAILASKSPVFLKMFSSGMLESEKDRPVEIKLGSQAEKSAFLEMLHYIYTSSFSDSCPNDSKSWEELVQLLLIGDIYQVTSMISAVGACILRKLPESIELVLKSAFELPEHLHQYAAIESLMKEARVSLFQRYKNVNTWNGPDFSSLSVEAVSFLLENDELQCDSEDEVFQEVLNWTRTKFESPETREGVMSELSTHLRFAHMSGEFLRERVVDDPDMRSFASQRHILEGLLHRASSESSKGKNRDKRFSERIGVQKPWTFEITCKARVDGAGQKTVSAVRESRGTKWYVKVEKEDQKNPNTVGIWFSQSSLTRAELAPLPKRVRGEFAAKSQASGEWTEKKNLERIFTDCETCRGYANFFGKSWDLLTVDRTWVDAAGDIEIKVTATVQLVT